MSKMQEARIEDVSLLILRVLNNTTYTFWNNHLISLSE